MSQSEIYERLRKCTGNPPGVVSDISEADVRLPADYEEFLSRMNGLEGFVAPEQYLILWRVEDMGQLNEAYAVEEFLPNVTLIGTDGGDTGFGYDSAHKQYIKTPLVGMERAGVETMGGSFEEFVKLLAGE
jgi:hypothetical protein